MIEPDTMRAPALSTDPPREQTAMVLLVDDQVLVVEAIRRCLANQPDIDFHYCIDPAKALEMANQIHPTVILQDLIMPGVDGMTLVSDYRANAGTETRRSSCSPPRKTLRSKARRSPPEPTIISSSCRTRSN